MAVNSGVLDGRVALVTGASSGLGARFAGVLRSAGADVVLTARGSAQFESVAGPIGAVALAGDITTVDHRQALASLIRERYGSLTFL